MSLRKIDESIPIPTDIPKWESIQCKLVTPMYGGGVKSAEPDIQQPIRVTAIRGQLRFWWRLLASQKVFELPENVSIRQAEFALWGGMNDGDESGKASAVLLRVNNVLFAGKNTWELENATELYTKYAPNMSDILNYVLFPARPKKGQPHKIRLFKPQLTWQLEWLLDRHADIFFEIKEDKDGKKIRTFAQDKYDQLLPQLITTFRWWATFGGIGARTRRGCGAFIVEKSTLSEIVAPLSLDEIQEANCKLALIDIDRDAMIKELEQEQKQKKSNSEKEKSKREKDDAILAWELAVKRLRDFRQGVGIGRNPPSEKARTEKKPAGRSRWTEPDAIRRLTKTYPAKHAPVHEGGNQFPRGMFGMPIIFHFSGNHEPQKSSLQPKDKERMASPVIIRPIYQNQKWQAAALLLPYDFSKCVVELKNIHDDNGKDNTPKTWDKYEVELWNKETAKHIFPIESNGGEDPLKAFMTYFAKQNKK